MTTPKTKDPREALVPFTFHEIATALIKERGLHEGYWGLYVEFGISAANVNMQAADTATAATLLPTALVPIKFLGLQPFPELNNLSVDAAKVNPKPKTTKTTKAKKKAT